MKRQVRKVAKDWAHPKVNGFYIPLVPGGYIAARAFWTDMFARFIKAKPTHPNPLVEFRGIYGDIPQPWQFMPDAGGDHYQMYETITAGTPISPVHTSVGELVCWLVDNGVGLYDGRPGTYSEWMKICDAC